MFRFVRKFHVTSILFESSLEGIFFHNTNIQIILWNFSPRNTTLLRNLSRNLKLFFSDLVFYAEIYEMRRPIEMCTDEKKTSHISLLHY